MSREMILRVLEDDGVDMRDAGSYYIGRCPFHDDKTPSFIIYKSDYRYRCFGCGECGDVIDYIMKTRELSFSQAVRRLNIDCKKNIRIKSRPGLMEVMAQEERDGIDVVKKYGKTFIDTMLAKEIVRRSNENKDTHN